MTKSKVRKKKDKLYRVVNGCSVRIQEKHKARNYGPGVILETNTGPEVRYEIGMEVLESQFPKCADVKWLIAKRCLVLIKDIVQEVDDNG